MVRNQEQQHDTGTKAAGAAVNVDVEHDPEVSRRASNAGLRREIQKKGPDGMGAEQVHAAAEQGVASPSQQLPHQDKIQASFGAHDVSGIQAHVDGGATKAMGAQAFATGNHVVFGGAPDLHTAAHEAAHVVQQAQGVNLKGGVGAAGDSYEQQADAVADRVVAGQSAADLLGPVAGAAQTGAVQRKEEKVADPKAAHSKSMTKSYGSVQSTLLFFAKELHAWGPELDAAMNMSTAGEAGSGPAVNAIMDIYQAAKIDAHQTSEVISAVKNDDRKTLVPEVKKVQGAFTRFWGHMQRASTWMSNHQGGSVDISAIQADIDGLTAKINVEVKLEPDMTEPAGDEKSMEKEMVKSQIEGLEAAIDSVKAGNVDDAPQVTFHARFLNNDVKKEHAADLKPHKTKLKALLAKLGEIRKEKPELADRFAEAYGHIASVLK